MTIRHTGVVDMATVIDTVLVVEEGATAMAKEAEFKQGVAEDIAALMEIAFTPVVSVKTAQRATSTQPPLPICKAAVL